MKTKLGWLGILAGTLMIFGCSGNEPAAPVTGSNTTPSAQFSGGMLDGCSVDPQFVDATGTDAYEAVLAGSQTDEGLWFRQHPVTNESGICRLYIEWEQGGTTCEWDDYIGYLTWNSYQQCTHVVYPGGEPVLDEFNAFIIEDSRDKVLAALADPITYSTDCGTFINRQSGVEITYVTFTDFDDAFAPLTRTVVITITP